MSIFDEMKMVEPAELERRGVIVPALNGGYICSCGSGRGANATGLSAKRYDWGYLYHCWSCKGNFTAVDLIGAYIGVDARMQTGKAQIADWYESNFSVAERGNIQVAPMKQTVAKAELKDLSKFYYVARNQLEKYLIANGGVIRGLSAEILRGAVAGIATHKDSENNWLVLPYDKCRCFKRELNGAGKYFTANAARSLYNPFNAFAGDKSVVFVVEGEINCLSIVQAGFNAVAVGGVENYAKLPEWLAALNLDYLPKIILLPDDDISKNEKIVDELLLLTGKFNEGCAVKLDFLNQNGMDANEILQREGVAELKNILTKIICWHEERQKELEDWREKYGQGISR